MISCQSFKGGSDPITITMINSDNKEARKVWELFSPVTMHCKSLEKYEDMDVNVNVNVNVEQKGMQE